MMRERGSATVTAIGVLAVAGLLALAIGTIAGMAKDRATARAAADLAALAGAYTARNALVADGSTTAHDDPCGAARDTAAVNAAQLEACRAFGDGSVQVSVASGRAHAKARAGPNMKGPDGGSG